MLSDFERYIVAGVFVASVASPAASALERVLPGSRLVCRPCTAFWIGAGVGGVAAAAGLQPVIGVYAVASIGWLTSKLVERRQEVPV